VQSGSHRRALDSASPEKLNVDVESLQALDHAPVHRYMAGCPCCDSRRGRPVSLRVTDNGRVLVHAFCGHETEDVLAALGLTLADLFDKPLAGVRGG
jgi:hypothetical protein